MNRAILLVIVLLIFSGFIFSEIHMMEDLVKPSLIIVKNNKLYVLEKTTISIYSIKDMKLINKFGKSGEGPREFMARPYGPPMSMSFVNGELVVNSNNKLSYFNPMGEFLRERKAFANLVLYQVKDNFVAIGPSPDDEEKFRISIRLYSNNLKEMKKLFHTNISVNPRDDFMLPLSAITHNPSYKDLIVIPESNKDFVISIFDHIGKRISKIEKKFDKVSIPEKFKSDTHEWFKKYSPYKQFYENVKQFIKFKEYFPAIRDLYIADNQLHVITYKRNGELWECVILDMKGNEIKRLFVPLDRYVPFTYYAILYSIDNDKMYSLIEDEDEETWELHITELNK
ncbi:MAG: hypothetical protein KAS21_08380 [Candidatus Aminicenantes bacterium]|nr:hypothetical protein [Candidatus Aminicenantes bacterium]